jgi:hypothetical protein
VSSNLRNAASGANLFKGIVARVGAPTTEVTAPRFTSGEANGRAAPLGAGRFSGGPAGGKLREPGQTAWRRVRHVSL